MTDVRVELSESVLIGSRDVVRGVDKFLGIPYALPPTGQHRFARPRPLTTSFRYGGGTLDCTKFAAVCPQPVFAAHGMPAARPIGSAYSENCLHVNIWRPSGLAPQSGWPVLAWIHGGFYQVGNPLHDTDPSELISNGGIGLQAIVVSIGYRLNIFGFLACSSLDGNFGLWDQRLALEWVHENIAAFAGDKNNITLAGLSAGANAVHQQINFEFFESTKQPIFHRAIMYSNAIACQSRSPEEADEQFEEVCRAFDITSEATFDEKLSQLRLIPDTVLADNLMGLTNFSFRHVTDDRFVSCHLVARAENGDLAAEFRRRNFALIIGEVENEETVYRIINAPTCRVEMLPLLQNNYSKSLSKKLFEAHPFPTDQDENDPDAWRDLFGRIVAACQVRAPIRALVRQLSPLGLEAKSDAQRLKVFRYRISMRLGILSAIGIPESVGVGHAMDQMIWWYQRSTGPGYTQKEDEAVKQWLSPFKKFVSGEADIDWGTTSANEYRVLGPDGCISIQADEYLHGFDSFANILIPSTVEQKSHI